MSTFAGERVVFDRCKFEGTNVLFDDVNYASGFMSFVEVQFSEDFMAFARTMFTGAKSIRTSSLPEERECVLRCCRSSVVMGLQRRHYRYLGDAWALLALRDVIFVDTRRNVGELLAFSEEDIASDILHLVDSGLLILQTALRRHRGTCSHKEAEV